MNQTHSNNISNGLKWKGVYTTFSISVYYNIRIPEMLFDFRPRVYSWCPRRFCRTRNTLPKTYSWIRWFPRSWTADNPCKGPTPARKQKKIPIRHKYNINHLATVALSILRVWQHSVLWILPIVIWI